MITKSRPRSSSRCSASVASSPWPRRRGSLLIGGLGGRLVLGRRRRRRCDRGLGGRELGLRLGSRVTRHRVLELAHTRAERAPDLRQSFATEQQQRDQEEEDDVPGLRESSHGGQRSAFLLARGEEARALARLVRVGWAGRKPRSCIEKRTHFVALLKLENLHVALEDGTEIVKGVDLEVSTNEVHAIMGPNGSGKSTLAYALMGHPAYEITEGR